MDINKMLNDIILKYELDRCYPTFRPWLKAQELIRQLVEDCDIGKRTAFIATNKDELRYFRRVTKERSHVKLFLIKPGSMQYIQKKNGKDRSQRYQISDTEIDYIRSCDACWLVSKPNDPLLEVWLSEQGICFESLYDHFFQHGCYLVGSYVCFLPNTFYLSDDFSYAPDPVVCEFFTQKCNYEKNEGSKFAVDYISVLIFLSLVLRDFFRVERYFHLLFQKGDFPKYRCAWKEICTLLNKLQIYMSQRKIKDFIMFWIDALSYDRVKETDFLHELEEQSISFSNIFTVSPITNPTAKALFCGTMPIDDHSYRVTSIDESNSCFLRLLKEKNYTFKVISAVLSALNHHEKQTDTFLYEGSIAPTLLWESLRLLAMSEEPLFLLVHFFAEIHSPQMHCFTDKTNIGNPEKTEDLGVREINLSLQYFSKFYSESAVRIYMSDHGSDKGGKRNYYSRCHPFMMIRESQHKGEKISGLASYKDFYKIFDYLIKNETLSERDLKREYVEIQELDFYNKNYIGTYIKEMAPLSNWLFGFRGIVTEKYIYLHFNHGVEWMARRDTPQQDPPLIPRDSAICAPEQLPYFRKLARIDEHIPVDEEKLKYSKFIYKVYKNILPKYTKKVDLLNGIFSDFPNHSVALRMGGAHTMGLYTILTINNRRKICCIIDENKECHSKDLGIPIVTLEEVKFDTLKAIVLSSLTHRHQLKVEAASYCDMVCTIDPYDLLEKENIEFHSDCYVMEGNIEDYDVGFPFDEMTIPDNMTNFS